MEVLVELWLVILHMQHNITKAVIKDIVHYAAYFEAPKNNRLLTLPNSEKTISACFEYEKGKYVTLTDDDFEKAKSEKDKSIHILHFTDIQNIRPIYFDKTYHAVPEQGGDKAFELLRRAMKDENKVAVAKTIIGTKEKLLALIPTDDGILIETLFFAEEVKETPKEVGHPAVQDAELTMA